jgi:hypothetical protein
MSDSHFPEGITNSLKSAQNRARRLRLPPTLPFRSRECQRNYSSLRPTPRPKTGGRQADSENAEGSRGDALTPSKQPRFSAPGKSMPLLAAVAAYREADPALRSKSIVMP